jgi:hypothetical protein
MVAGDWLTAAAAEIDQLEAEAADEGVTSYSAPPGSRRDLVAALAYARELEEDAAAAARPKTGTCPRTGRQFVLRPIEGAGDEFRTEAARLRRWVFSVVSRQRLSASRAVRAPTATPVARRPSPRVRGQRRVRVGRRARSPGRSTDDDPLPLASRLRGPVRVA